MKVKIKKLHPDAVVPTYATDGSACFDLTAICEPMIHKNDDHAAIYRTGISFEVPTGHVMLIYSRSGHGFNDAIRLSNCVGVIDSDYRGEVMVSLRFDASGTHRSKKVREGDRIAQAMILPVHKVGFEVVDELSETKRGNGGFGSTGT